MNSNVKGHKNDLQKSSEYWTVERSKKLLQNGKIHYLYKQHDNVTQEVIRALNQTFCNIL